MSKTKQLFGVEIGERFEIHTSFPLEPERVWNNCVFDKDGALIINGKNSSYNPDTRLLLGQLIIGDKNNKIVKYNSSIVSEEEKKHEE